jgi:predicted nucleotidyltransferase
MNVTETIPPWLDKATQTLVKGIVSVLSGRHPDLLAVILYGSVARHEERSLDVPDPSDVDLLAILDSDDPHAALYQGPRVAQRDVLPHELALGLPLTILHPSVPESHPRSCKQADKNDEVACGDDPRNSACLLQSRCAIRGKHKPWGNGPQIYLPATELTRPRLQDKRTPGNCTPRGMITTREAMT